MNDQSLLSLLETVWSQMIEGALDRHHPARHPTLATTSSDGPELRTLVLRAVSQTHATLEFHTDAASPKAEQILQSPSVAIHFWIPKTSLQIRLRATAQLLPGDPAMFAQLPQAAQENYQGAAPGTPLPADPAPLKDRFTRILCHVSEIDVLLLSTPHKRALYTSATNWEGAWTAP